MKKYISCIIAIVLVFHSLSSLYAHEEPPKTIQEKQKAEATRLKIRDAKIRKMFVFETTYVKGEAQLPALRALECAYDSNGCLSEQSVFRNDTLIAKTMNYYNSSFQWVTTLDFKDGKRYSGVERYEYTDNGLILQINEISPSSKFVGRIEYEYNNLKKSITQTKLDSLDKLEYSVEYIYDKDFQTGKCIEIIKKDATGKQSLRVSNLYDAAGNRTEKRIYNANDSLSYYFQYTYNAAGDFLEIKKISDKGQLMGKDRYAYNDQGFITTVTSYNELNVITSLLEYKYYMPAKQ